MSIKLKDTIYDLINNSIKLQTSRKLWGQSFDGTANVNGKITIEGIGSIAITQKKGNNTVFNLGSGSNSTAQSTEYGILQLFQNSSELVRIYAEDSASWINAGNFGIGTTSPLVNFM